MRFLLLLSLLLATSVMADDPLLNLREARKTQRITRKHLPGLGLTRPLRRPGILTDNSRRALLRYASRSREPHRIKQRR